jgi:hypothetical protein
MAKQEILGDQRLTIAHGRTDQAEDKLQVLEHRPKIMPHSTPNRAGRLFRPDRAS